MFTVNTISLPQHSPSAINVVAVVTTSKFSHPLTLSLSFRLSTTSRKDFVTFTMALDGHSLDSVRKWAKQNFAADFQRLPHTYNFKLRLHMVPDYEETGYIKGLIVGTTLNKTQKPVDVLAWLEGSHMKTGYIGRTRTGKTEIRYKSLTTDTIRFNWPYYCILEGKTDAAIARFEALVRYCFLIKGGPDSTYIRDGFDNFVAHFPGACQDVAADHSWPIEQSTVMENEIKAETADKTDNYERKSSLMRV